MLSGTCSNNLCTCYAGWTGQYCDMQVSSLQSSSSNVLAVVLGTIIPVSAIFALCLILVILGFIFAAKRKRHGEEWVIDVNEIDFGENIGTGGYGQVKKAIWRGTEVAVKTLITSHISNDIRNAFITEVSPQYSFLLSVRMQLLTLLFSKVQVMTALRHPNVVLFMGASTKPPNMFIVMEFMALGSLHDVLHNELIPEIPAQLKVKMVKQASKGMYFLHSSGTHAFITITTIIRSLKACFYSQASSIVISSR